MTETQQSTQDTFEAVVVDVDGYARVVAWEPTADDTLRNLQGAVGGLVATVELDPALTMWVNDEGILKDLPVNLVASSIARMFGFTHQLYYGPAVFTGGADSDGNTLPLAPREIESLMLLGMLIRSKIN